ncbi:hypothetical protein BCV69DRAFT_199182 [Microstroma glucosiphilum]|uniref:Uncharacterized protein n=1 Tax=Pseudomicrostroma glucosiphilum TaxID=1684307 RepID=A0A316U8S0_9BASI|nr:hypothetical protein BCV69DRAFT_199182 [Pseudomicrostroma glucosiphilum]PWN20773.1 hypothetical protein BCV69DRAFT_199182 [Pseudomicrostroma glucosiphilum]
MPRRKADANTAPSRNHFDTSPGNPDGYRPLIEWGTKETQATVEAIARIILSNRASLRAEPALQPWTWKWGDPINGKVKQLLAKLCKDYDVDFNSICTTRGPQKREAGSADEGEDKKPMASPKKARPSPVKKAAKASVPVTTEANVGATPDGEDSIFTPSPSPAPRKEVSGTPPVVKEATPMPITPQKIKEEPVTPVKSEVQAKKTSKETPSPSAEDKMDVDVEDEGEVEEEEEPPIKQGRRKKAVIADDYTPSRSVTPTLASGPSFAAPLCESPNRPKRGCAKRKDYNMALNFDGLDDYLKETEGIEEESDEQEQSVEGDEEEKAADGDTESEGEGDLEAGDEGEDK